MNHTTKKEIIKTLLESRFYFYLSLKERLGLVKYLLSIMPPLEDSNQ